MRLNNFFKIEIAYSLHEKSHFDFSASLFDNIWSLKFFIRRYEFENTYFFLYIIFACDLTNTLPLCSVGF